MNWANQWNNQIDKSGRDTEETREMNTHGPPLVFPAASAPPRQTDFIWRIKQMHLEIALCVSLSLSACLTLSLPLFHILPLSPSFSLSWLFWLVNYFIQHICWIDAWIIHQLHVATIISCYFYLPGSLCSVKQFKVLLARFLQRLRWGGWGVDGVGRGEKRGKQIQELNNIDNNMQQNQNRFIYQIDWLCRQVVLQSWAAGIQFYLRNNLVSGFSKLEIHLHGGWECRIFELSSSESAQFALDKHFACPVCFALQHIAELLSVKPALTWHLTSERWEIERGVKSAWDIFCERVHKSVICCIGNVTSKEITGGRNRKGCVQRSRLTSACKKIHSLMHTLTHKQWIFQNTLNSSSS